jgi:hypothetical protein
MHPQRRVLLEQNRGELVSVEDNRAGDRVSLKIWTTNNRGTSSAPAPGGPGLGPGPGPGPGPSPAPARPFLVPDV